MNFLGLLPEEWDAVITKFVYPSFTPTVGLFLAGAVFYGVYKILQGNEVFVLSLLMFRLPLIVAIGIERWRPWKNEVFAI